MRLDIVPPGEAVEFPQIDALTTAAGASIVWLNSQGDEQSPQTWVSNLLRAPVFSPPGSWEARVLDDEVPEVIFALRQGREVSIEAVGFALPQSDDGSYANAVRVVEVLATDDPALRLENFRPLGRFELEPKTDLQEFAFGEPANCRFLVVRLQENFGGEKLTLARMSVRLAKDAPLVGAVVAERTEVEARFAGRPDAFEQEPNDEPAEATPLVNGQTLEATIRSGERDLFRLPDPPAS
ncbi:hypothetical protein IH992_33930, partial [Candidatus Poribacteria bacterium]|nr:hypothetical protein [Candidatus Poribacteria bacterium]